MTPEFELIKRHFTRVQKSSVLGVGDDCALFIPGPGLAQAVSTDMLVEGRHFAAGADPEKLGRKSLAVNLSDLAAMGATPRFAFLALALPTLDDAWLAAYSRGFFSMADAHGVELAGGDTTGGPLNICITVMGEVAPEVALRRDAARDGDDVWLSGHTGCAALALAHREGRVSLPAAALEYCATRLDDPEPRVALGRRLLGVARGAIDISDGLLADVGHIAERSGLRIEIEREALPVHESLLACNDAPLRIECLAAGGDDYELAFVAPRNERPRIEEIGRDLGVKLTRIGCARTGDSRAVLVDERGVEIPLRRAGFDHFSGN
jgi:thiamine-monophosphate kinase